MQGFDHRSGHHLGVDGAQIYYELAGDPRGQPLLFLHGGLGNIEEANAFLTRLEAPFQLIGIDSRGHGRSTLGSSGLSYARMQKDVECILRHLAIESLSIVGFSDGGIVGYRLAATSALHIRKLVTIGAQWRAPGKELRTLYAGVTGDSWKRKFPESFASYQQLNPEPDFDRLVHAATTMWLDTSEAAYPGDSVERIRCPSLLVRGDEDKFISLPAIAELASRIPSAKVFNIPFATHVAYAEQPDILLPGLRHFLCS